jgi:hypothetical protein
MSDFDPESWSSFFLAQTGAAAALAGLVIVAISINLAVILKHPSLPGRAAETLVLLTGVLVMSSLGLVPGQPLWLLGAEAIVVGYAVLGLTVPIQLRATRKRHPQEKRWLRWLFILGASLPLLAAGLSLILETGGGLYWLVPGIMMALVGAILNAWVLLVEILR